MSVEKEVVKMRKGGNWRKGLIFLIVVVAWGCGNPGGPIIDSLFRAPQPPLVGTPTSMDRLHFGVAFIDPDLEPMQAPTVVTDFGLFLDQIKLQFPDRVRRQFDIVDYINQATRSIRLAIPEINLNEVVDALISARLRGVQIEVVTEKFYRDSDGSPLYDLNGVKHNDRAFYDRLVANGITVVDDGDLLNRQMHAKYMIVDAESNNPRVIVSTGNFTARTFHFSNSLVVVIDSKRVADAFVADFTDMLFGLFGITKPLEHSEYLDIHLGNSRLDLYFGPGNSVIKAVLADKVFAGVEQSAAFAIHDFTDSAMGDRVQSLLDRGFNVSGIFDGVVALREGGGSQFFRPALTSYWFASHSDALSGVPGLGIDLSDEPPYRIRFMNLKYVAVDPQSFILDPQVAITTSNWDNLSFTANDEVLLVFHDQPLTQFFYTNIHPRALMGISTVEGSLAEGITITEPPVARVFARVQVKNPNLPSPFTDPHPSAGDVSGVFRSLGVANQDFSFDLTSQGTVEIFPPVGVVIVCLNAGGTMGGGGGQQASLEACATPSIPGGGGSQQQTAYRPILFGPMVLLPGAQWSSGPYTFKPVDPFQSGGGGGTGGGGTGGGGGGGTGGGGGGGGGVGGGGG